MKKVLLFFFALLALTSCETEKEPPSGASVILPQITLVNNSPSKAYLLIFNTNGDRIAGTDKLAPNTSAQAKFTVNNIDPAGEYVIIKVYKREDSASDKKLYEEGFRLYPRSRYTYTVDKDYNVNVIRHY